MDIACVMLAHCRGSVSWWNELLEELAISDVEVESVSISYFPPSLVKQVFFLL